jgi:hypothetical protein
MPGMSTYIENALLNTIRNIPFSVTTTYVSLHTADPGGTGANEVTGGSYARVAITWNAPSAGSMINSAPSTVNVPASTTVTHFGVWDAVTTGNFLGKAALSATQTFSSGGTLSFGAGQLTWNLTQ